MRLNKNMITVALVSLVLTTASPGVSLTKVKEFTSFKVTALATSATGGLFAVASEDLKVRVIDSKTMQTRQTLSGHPMTPYAVAFSKDGKLLASGDETARIMVWDVKSGKKLREFPREKGHKRGIQALAFSADGKLIASIGKDDVMMVWKTSGGNPVKVVPGNGANLYGLAYMKTGAIATATLAEGLRLYGKDAANLAAKMKVDGGQGANDVAVNAAGTVGVTGGRDGKLVFWDMKAKKQLGAVPACSDWILDVEFTPNGKLAVCSSSDATVKVVDTKAMKVVATLDGRAVVDSLVGVTNDGKYLLTTDGGNRLQVFQFSVPTK